MQDSTRLGALPGWDPCTLQLDSFDMDTKGERKAPSQGRVEVEVGVADRQVGWFQQIAAERSTCLSHTHSALCHDLSVVVLARSCTPADSFQGWADHWVRQDADKGQGGSLTRQV